MTLAFSLSRTLWSPATATKSFEPQPKPGATVLHSSRPGHVATSTDRLSKQQGGGTRKPQRQRPVKTLLFMEDKQPSASSDLSTQASVYEISTPGYCKRQLMEAGVLKPKTGFYGNSWHWTQPAEKPPLNSLIIRELHRSYRAPTQRPVKYTLQMLPTAQIGNIISRISERKILLAGYHIPQKKNPKHPTKKKGKENPNTPPLQKPKQTEKAKRKPKPTHENKTTKTKQKETLQNNYSRVIWLLIADTASQLMSQIEVRAGIKPTQSRASPVTEKSFSV